MKREWKPTVVTALAALFVVTVSGVVLAGGPGWKGGKRRDFSNPDSR